MGCPDRQRNAKVKRKIMAEEDRCTSAAARCGPRTSKRRLGADQYVQLTTCIGYYAMLAMTVKASNYRRIRSMKL